MAENKNPNPKLSEEVSKTNAKTSQTQRARGISNNKSVIQRENINPTLKNEVKTDLQKWNKAMDKRFGKTEKGVTENPKIKTSMPKIPAIAKGVGKVLGRLVPVAGAAITAKEVYDYVEQKIEKPEPPPRLENIENPQNLSADEKENISSMFKDWAETEQPSYLQGMEKGIDTPNLEFEINEISRDFSMEGDSASDGGADGGGD